MQFKGLIKELEVYAPVQVANLNYFFTELAKGEMRIQFAKKEDIA